MGIDEIFCVAVNDAFVMNAWARDQGIEDEVALLPDGNGDFTRAMGMLADQSGRGFGARSRRYSMVAHDGVIQQIFLENRDGRDNRKRVVLGKGVSVRAALGGCRII